MPKNTIAALATIAWLTSGPALAEDDPERWFRQGYAPLWAERPEEHLDSMLTFYGPVVQTHRADGTQDAIDRRDFLAPSLAEWTAEGWVSSELDALLVDRVNDGTVVFKAAWVDRYLSAPQERSCGWYLANRLGDEWRFTAYADLDCEAHDL